ncbi:NifU family protein [Ureaplasma diversum]|uniref:NifU family protein n=1 Tax=Ureaplasma diversum TaxID=42094 RepID=UPI001AD7EA24|nr:NifU family protein [Ureaplasma diversum]
MQKEDDRLNWDYDQQLSKIKEVLEMLREYVRMDGGDFEFVKYEDQCVYIKILGACVGCMLLDVTYKEGLERILKKEVPQIKEVELIVPKFDTSRFFPFNF